VEPMVSVENMNWVARAFYEGGPVMYVIAVIGCLSFILILERFFSLRYLTVNKNEFSENIFAMILRGDLKQAINYCDGRRAPVTNTLKSGLIQVLNHRPDEEIQVAMDASVLRETPKLEGWSGFLAVFGNLAVLSGLLGTIIGMIKSFRGVATAADGASKSSQLAEGISHALNCTAFGLSVAIVSILAYGYFQVRISRAENDLVESSMNLMNIVAANRDKLKR
jgi:biopolymer transport protein ExbB